MHGIHVTGFVSNEACFKYDIKHGLVSKCLHDYMYYCTVFQQN